MKKCFAPLEGITGFIFRNTYHQFYGGIDVYYTPFISVNQTCTLKKNELSDLLPKNNHVPRLIPQILANNTDDALAYIRMIAELDYDEINLNMGCPSGTVVAKGKGSGMLRDLKALDLFLERLFCGLSSISHQPPQLSVKTRIGIRDLSESTEVLATITKYPFCEVILHPRLQKEFYKVPVHQDVVLSWQKELKVPLIYNGDLNTPRDIQEICQTFPSLAGIMLGRGLLWHPSLINNYVDSCSNNVFPSACPPEDPQKLKCFHDTLFNRLLETMQEPNNVIHRMKELWFYMGCNYPDNAKALKAIKKARNIPEYQAAVRILLQK